MRNQPGSRLEIKTNSGDGHSYTVHVETNRRIAIDTADVPWEERWNEHLGKMLYRKNLIEDSETGVEIRLVRYPAGVINTRHIHTCAHGMYVLDGTLRTDGGDYGPGHFVWFPAGIEMEHGATAEKDVTVLFITNRRFDIHYLPAE